MLSSFVFHLKAQMRDRDVNNRIEHIAASNFKQSAQPVDIGADLLNACIDAIEQGKFKIPREGGRPSKAAANMWRPQLHVSGMIIDGVKELWFVSNCTLPKDADTEISYLLQAINKTDDDRQRLNRTLPQCFRITGDNATGELKHQTVYKFMGSLVFFEVFRICEIGHFRPGHSHKRQDRRFASRAEAIKKTSLLPLEDDSDFDAVLQNELLPLPGYMKQKIIRLCATWDWRELFATLELNVSGHTSTKGKLDAGETACHVFRFVLRKDLHTTCLKDVTSIAAPTTNWPSLEENPRDVMLLIKNYISSNTLSQAPTVFCRVVLYAKLALADLRLGTSMPLTTMQKNELEKTAKYYEKTPRRLHRTASYLRGLIACDGTPCGEPPTLGILQQYAAGVPPTLLLIQKKRGVGEGGSGEVGVGHTHDTGKPLVIQRIGVFYSAVGLFV